MKEVSERIRWRMRLVGGWEEKVDLALSDRLCAPAWVIRPQFMGVRKVLGLPSPEELLEDEEERS